MPKMSAEELGAFLEAHFPGERFPFSIERVEEGRMRLRLHYHDRHLRPGGTISGPSLMTLADSGAYLLVLSMIGPVALAVTTSLNINFLRKPAPKDVLADARLLKLGARLAIIEVSMFSEGEDDLVAHATVTYSIPPEKRMMNDE
ncbi:MAG: PaaI family thioesterase [Blastocatellia bacterium]|nr:PaaI family thioesterase [Blastocatellia bacterium]